MKLFSGTSSRTLTIRFVADVFKAQSDIKKTGHSVDRLSSKIKNLNMQASSYRAKRNMGFNSAWSDQGFGYSGARFDRGFAMSRTEMARQGMRRTGAGRTMGRGFAPLLGGGGMGGGSVGRLNQAFNGLSGASGGLISAFNSIPGPIKVVVGALIGMGYAINKMVKMGTFVEGRMTQMEVLTGSAEKSRQLTKEAVKYSVLTPFSPSQVFGATSTAVQFGFKDVFKKGAYGLGKTKSLADIAAGLGSVPDLSGKMMGMDRMMNAIMRGDYRLLRPVRGMVQPAYEKAKATGHKVGTPGFNLTFVKALGKIPAIMNLAKKQSETVAGLWSTISGFADDMWISLSGVSQEPGILTFWSQLRGILKDIRDVGLKIFEYLTPFFVELGAHMGMIFKAPWDMMKDIASLFLPMLKAILKITVQIARFWMSVIGFAIKVIVRSVKFIVNMIDVIMKGFDRMLNVTGGFKLLVNTITEMVTGIQMIFQMSMIYIDWAFKQIVRTTDQIFNRFGKKYDQFQKVLRILGAVASLGSSEVLLRSIEGDYVPANDPSGRSLKQLKNDVTWERKMRSLEKKGKAKKEIEGVTPGLDFGGKKGASTTINNQNTNVYQHLKPEEKNENDFSAAHEKAGEVYKKYIEAR